MLAKLAGELNNLPLAGPGEGEEIVMNPEKPEVDLHPPSGLLNECVLASIELPARPTFTVK